MTRDLPRTAGRPDRGGRKRPVPRARPGPGTPAGRLLAGRRRRRALRRARSSRPPDRSPPRSSRTSPSTRRSARTGWPPWSGSGPRSRPTSRSSIDAKRGDIGSTAARHAVALFDRLGADAVTVNPYPGGEAIEPLLERTDRYAYVLCRTSNPEAAEFQNLVVAADPSIDAPAEALHLRVARRAATWGPGGTVGLVVGATAPAELHDDPRRGAGPRLPRAGDRRPGRGDRAGPARRSRDGDAGCRGRGRRPARQRLAGHQRRRAWASRTRSGRPIRESGLRRPPATGLRASLCYPNPRTRSPRRPRPAYRSDP